MVRVISLFILLLVSILPARSQGEFDKLLSRLQAFGKRLPQEQVFIHMDNTCYHLGDTIFYKAFVRREDHGHPTNISGVLYCELLSNDGFLVERQAIRLSGGEGDGSFCLNDSLLYAGFYELRAYTKWQLNWGRTSKEHGTWIHKYFFNDEMADDYFQDYEKLYSRVFPVYDRPLSAGENYHDMTLRPLASYYKQDNSVPKTLLQFFPEGGELVADIPTRVAWEARNESGVCLDGTLRISLPDGTEITSHTLNRGRGLFDITAPKGATLKASFTPDADQSDRGASDARPATAELPEVQDVGVALHVETDTAAIHVRCAASPSVDTQHLGVTIMHAGVLCHFSSLAEGDIHFRPTKPGVYQTTVFDTEGRVYADRLSFYRPTGFSTLTMEISGVKSGKYQPFEHITIQLRGLPESSVAVAVRDAASTEFTYDTGNILTEQLLSSQIRGFVPHPQWFFQEDTPQRRQALDLLLMVQGWRKYSWHEMAVPGTFELTHAPEGRFMHWQGQINNYSLAKSTELYSGRGKEMTPTDGKEKEMEKSYEYSSVAQEASERSERKQNALKHPMALHAEFAQPGSESVIGDMTSQGSFALDFPAYYGEFFFFLGASDTTKWKKGHAPIWTQNGRTKSDEVDYPEFYVKLDPAFPRFPKAYDYYQSHLAPMPMESPLYNSMDADVRLLSEVTVGARRSGRRKFAQWKPAFVVDAYEAFNTTCDAGLTPGYFVDASRFIRDVALAYLADMGCQKSYDVSSSMDGKSLVERTARQREKQKTGMQDIPESTTNISDWEQRLYNYLWNLSDVKVYTDFSPRNEKNRDRLSRSFPTVHVDLVKMPDGGERNYQRNRRWKMKGFSVAEEFYSPDYSGRPLPPYDYRRTLYWNPSVTLDHEGCATVTLYNNSTPTFVQVSAEGWSKDGISQSGKVH